jgi:hypothetical protein
MWVRYATPHAPRAGTGVFGANRSERLDREIMTETGWQGAAIVRSRACGSSGRLEPTRSCRCSSQTGIALMTSPSGRGRALPHPTDCLPRQTIGVPTPAAKTGIARNKSRPPIAIRL